MSREHPLVSLSVDGGGVALLPVDTPYDQDLLFEYLRALASVHREVTLRLADLRATVNQHGDGIDRCLQCERVLGHGALQFLVGGGGLCSRCARSAVRLAELAACFSVEDIRDG